MKEFNKQTLEHLESLAKIKLSEEEKADLFQSIQKILIYMEQLSSIDTEGVEPCNYVLQGQQSNVFRKDEMTTPLPRDVFLDNSPDQIGGMIRVPPIINQD